nr:hypothetical protein CFP56_63580 [Quercus suber]
MEVICGRGIGLANGISSLKEMKSARSLMIPPLEEEMDKRVEVWRVTRWWRICETAILAMVNENSDGFWGSS